MENELQKLRIDKSLKASRATRSRWPWVVAIILLVVAIIGYFGWKKSSAGVPVQTMRVTVPEGTVTESDLVMLNATGYIIAAHKIELASKVVGRVAWVGVEMGDKINTGQVLVRLEDDEYKARVALEEGQLDAAKAKLAALEAGLRPQEIARAKAGVDEATASLDNAKSNLARLEKLDTSLNVSFQEINDARTLADTRAAQLDGTLQQYSMAKEGPRKEEIDAARATVRQLEGSLSLATVDASNTVIHSPITGTVLERNVEVGEFVTTGFVGDRGAKGYVVSIADLNDLRVELDVSQNDFAKVSPEQPCWITTDAYPDRKYSGVVDLISPEANRQKATVQVRVKVLNPDELLKPDMNATVAFLSAKKLAATQSATSKPESEGPAIRVPQSAIRDGAVFVVENGKASQRTVTVGERNANGDVEIRKGLIGGEDLITVPPGSLKDGQSVKMGSS